MFAMPEIGGKCRKKSVKFFQVKVIYLPVALNRYKLFFISRKFFPEIAYDPPADQQIICPDDITEKVDAVTDRLKSASLFVEIKE